MSEQMDLTSKGFVRDSLLYRKGLISLESFEQSRKSFLTGEYPLNFTKGAEPYYPINDDHNNTLYEKYRMLAQQEERVKFGGRLAEYKYYNMDEVVKRALDFCNK